ncbi:MAG: cytochrome c [Candidatus Marinimicrobia bacterium]|nr:cytochrome c [Candidatus Neomarinimicrobiota bacterium]MBT4063764.1 cytochrome c [Candidatus Neomarinimicrobiota bacterium]
MKKTYTFIIIAWTTLSSSILGQDVEGFYKQNCASCHTIGGGRLTGPDLKNIHLRKDEDWIKKFIANPQAVINSGDAYARELLSESRGVVMPKVGGLTPFIIQSLVDFIIDESSKEKSKYGSSAIADRPLTPGDIVKGRALFLGVTKLKNNGPTCIGCHSVAGEGLLGGGLLGPDLTNVYGRLGGKKPLAAWLASPGSETMGPIYQKYPIDEEEVLPLVALFKDKTLSNVTEAGVHDFNFIIIGFVGLAIVLVLFDLFWGNRLRSIRRKMVEGKI